MEIVSWKEFVKNYSFRFKNEFFEMPFLSNSPDLMLNSIMDIPITTHNQKSQILSSKNSFCTSTIHYRELDAGFWLLAFNMTLKRNLLAKSIYEEEEECEYYFLVYSVFDYGFPLTPIEGKSIVLKSKCWVLYKQKTKVSTYFYQQTTGKFATIVFTKEWAETHLNAAVLDNPAALSSFLDNKPGYLTWLDVVPEAQNKLDAIYSLVRNNSAQSTQKLQSVVLNLMISFFNATNHDNRMRDFEPFANNDYAKIAHAERLILQNLNMPFIGISAIAEIVQLAPTQLKQRFKMVFGFSILQYRKEKNLLLAEQLLRDSKVAIKKIASITGYENPSKFATTFKRKFGFLPAQIRKN